MSTRYTRSRPSEHSTGWLARLLQRKILLANLAITLTALTMAVIFIATRESPQKPETVGSEKKRTRTPDNERVTRKKKKSAATTAKRTESFLCNIYTDKPAGSDDPPHFFLLVDGEPARNADDEWLKTPCQIRLLQGTHEITIAQRGFIDRSRFVNIKADTQIQFAAPGKAGPDETSIVESAYIDAQTATPIPLVSLDRAKNDAHDLDPYITPDGTGLYFVSNRESKSVYGIYYTARKTDRSYFTQEPKLIEGTRGSDLLASPSVTDDALAILYSIPKLRRVYAITREEPGREFRVRRVIPTPRISQGSIPSVQAVRQKNREWLLYWTQSVDDRMQTLRAVSRVKLDGSSGQDDEEELAPLRRQSFTKSSRVSLPGVHPCLSQDGLRQYVFDGKNLRRATRISLDQPFPDAEVIAGFNIANYRPLSHGRSFSISDDERWLFYESEGSLNMIRVFRAKRGGLIVRGKSIPSLAPVPQVAVQTKPRGKTAGLPGPAGKKKQVDPRTLPLPYPEFRTRLLGQLKARKYAEAGRSVRAAIADAKYARDTALLRWDLDDIDSLEAFWKDVRESLKSLKPDAKFSLGPSTLKFVRFADGTVEAKSRTRTIKKEIVKMRPLDLITIVYQKFGRKDPLRQAHIGSFLHYDGQGNPRTAAVRFKLAAKAGTQFYDRLAMRELSQARHEYDRDNVGAGLKRIDLVLKQYPQSKAAETARAMIDEAYRKTTWTVQGRRKWQIKEGAYTAAQRLSAGSLLRSPRQFENFELRLQWRSDVANGQGGVYFRYPGAGNPLDNAFKIQLSDDSVISKPDPVCTGALYKIAAPTENAVRKQGEWNTLLLRVRGESVLAIINGRKVLETTAASEEIPIKGYLALDGKLGGITYRKMLLIELPKGD
ncbi:MAG: DUF1080 domain-containing protein [Planctomycetes bacterium]|nr:DUF1080 domain-containing protein [Planctomycetota bacterium]